MNELSAEIAHNRIWFPIYIIYLSAMSSYFADDGQMKNMPENLAFQQYQ